MSAPPTSDHPLVITLLSQLLRFDTSNWGGNRAHGETGCAEWIAALLTEAGYHPQLVSRPDAPQRGNLVVRVPGTDPQLPGLLVQGHLDVVPADPDEWTVDPFGGLISAGYVYGRGATDMKDFCASMLATLLEWAAEGVRPRCAMVFAFVADEEALSEYGAHWLVREHPELFAGCSAAISEEGGAFTPALDADGRVVRLYPVACGERGTRQLRLIAHGPSGHGSRPSGDDAVHRLVEVLHRIGTHRWPMRLGRVVSEQLSGSAQALGLPLDLTEESSVLAVIDALGPAAGPLPWSIRVSATPTVLQAGYKVNVVPGRATAEVDVRVPPGAELEAEQTLLDLIGDQAEIEWISRSIPVEASTDSPWYAAMRAAIRKHDPAAVVLPLCMGGGTDAKAFSQLGIECYGFTPLLEDPEGRRAAGIHGPDERVPVAALVGGHAVLRSFLESL